MKYLRRLGTNTKLNDKTFNMITILLKDRFSPVISKFKILPFINFKNAHPN